MPDDTLFDHAVERLLLLEGGLAEHPSDPGGLTNFGISLRYAAHAPAGLLDVNDDGQVDGRDIRALTRADAVRIYREDWWDRMRLGDLPPAVAIQMLDLAVNMGRVQAVRELQSACAWHGEMLAVDGVLGALTRAAAGRIGDALVWTLKAQAAGFYRMLAVKRPQLGVFADGWRNRMLHPVVVPQTIEAKAEPAAAEAETKTEPAPAGRKTGAKA